MRYYPSFAAHDIRYFFFAISSLPFFGFVFSLISRGYVQCRQVQGYSRESQDKHRQRHLRPETCLVLDSNCKLLNGLGAS